MGRSLSAHVSLELGGDFAARIANLTTSSLFVSTHRLARFREKITVTFWSVSVVGEVVHASSDPPGFVMVFDPTPEVERVISEGLVDPLWPDQRQFDRQPTLENLIPPAITERSIFDEPTVEPVDEPTNINLPAIVVPEEEDTGDVLETPAGVPDLRDSPRLRATTMVGDRHPTDEIQFDDPVDD